MSDDDVKRLLSEFKTSACNNDVHHDFSLCPYFHHGDTDRRRNPYEQYYDLDACVNAMETMYHPAIFRTIYCQRRGGQLSAPMLTPRRTFVIENRPFWNTIGSRSPHARSLRCRCTSQSRAVTAVLNPWLFGSKSGYRGHLYLQHFCP